MKAESVEVTLVAKPQSNKTTNKETPTRRQWSDLPQELLNLIISKLYFTDRIRFRAVCKDWHLTIGDRSVDELPWVVNHTFFYDTNPCFLPVKRTKVMISDPIHKKTHTIPNFTGTRARSVSVSFPAQLKPYSLTAGRIIFLQPLGSTWGVPVEPKVEPKTVLNSRREVQITLKAESVEVLVVAKPQSNKRQYTKRLQQEDNGCGKLGAFNLESQEWSWLVDSLWIPRDHMHLVEYNGYLFLAKCSFDYLKWKVFRYAENDRGWIEQQSLGDKALFVSMYGSYLRPAVGDTDLADQIFCICYYINALGSTWGVPVEPKAELKTVLDSRRKVQITMKAESVEVTVVAKPQSNKKIDKETPTKRQWSNLPQDILNLIISKLYYTDRIHFRAVCKDWHLPIGDRLVDELPWIVNHILFFDINPRFLPLKRTNVMISDPVHKRTHAIPNFPGTRGEYLKCFGNSRVCGSKCGWLLLGNYNSYIGIDVFLYCPFTNNLIRLPAISTIIYYYYEATFSSSNPTSPDCVFVFVYTYYCLGQYIVGFSTYRNGDNEWRTKILDGGFKHSIKSLVCTEKGVCYFVLGCGKLGAFHVESQEWSWLVDSLWIPRDHMHLVESNGYLFLAACSFDYLK
ncbi:hypothetical protein LguiA_030366 [Lonicera macranthoides]